MSEQSTETDDGIICQWEQFRCVGEEAYRADESVIQ